MLVIVLAFLRLMMLLLAWLLWFNVPLRAWLRGRRFPLRDRHNPLLAYIVLALLAMIWSCGSDIYCGGLWTAPGIHGLPAKRRLHTAAGLAAWARRGGPTYRNASACLPPPCADDAWLASQPNAPPVELPLGGDEVAQMWYQTRNHTRCRPMHCATPPPPYRFTRWTRGTVERFYCFVSFATFFTICGPLY